MRLSTKMVLCVAMILGMTSGQGVIKAAAEFVHKYKLLVFSENTQFWFVKI